MKPMTREWVKKAENDFKVACQTATVREAKVALKHCRSLRAEARRALGLKT
jgi:hypothetical protein